MTSKERVLAAARCQEVDHVPFIIHFHEKLCHPRADWRTERERLARMREWGWDTYVPIRPALRPDPEARIDVGYEGEGDARIVRQVWRTPAGTLEERLRVTDDWPEAERVTDYLPFADDFRPSRYVEVPIKDEADLAALEYLLPVESPRDEEATIQTYRQKRALAVEFEVPLIARDEGGMNLWLQLHPAQEAVLRAVLQPNLLRGVLRQTNAAYRRRLDLLLDLGVDGVIRNGWYETTDFWSPALVREHAWPAVEATTWAARAAGAVAIYLLVTRIMPLLPSLADLPFDCLFGAEPVLAGGQDLEEMRRRLPGKSLWGGISGPEHLARGTPDEAERAVESAFADLGRTGFILGPAVAYRDHYSWANLDAAERAWKRLR